MSTFPKRRRLSCPTAAAAGPIPTFTPSITSSHLATGTIEACADSHGSHYVSYYVPDYVPGLRLSALCSIRPPRFPLEVSKQRFEELLESEVVHFARALRPHPVTWSLTKK